MAQRWLRFAICFGLVAMALYAIARLANAAEPRPASARHLNSDGAFLAHTVGAP